MTLISEAAAKTDLADLIILRIVETIRDQQEPATASAVASFIGGAPAREVYARLRRLYYLQALECQHVNPYRYQLTELGAELLRQELIGWTPSNREEARRQNELRARLSKALGS